ncbi:B12-binding domain-containing radical SAM protein [Candidatus Latescibacterota bacterium]
MRRRDLRPIRKITFLQPPALLKYPASKTVWPPLGILYLVATTRKAGYEVHFIDAMLEGFDLFTPFDDETHILGLPPDVAAERVLRSEPDLLAVSLQFQNHIDLTMEITDRIKQERPGCFILAGGPIVTLKPDKVMELQSIDGIVLGEGDTQMLEYIDNLNAGWSSHLPGCGIRLDEAVTLDRRYGNVDNLDSVPFPARDIVDMERYIEAIRKFKMLPRRPRATTMLSSRGCPNRCCFCASRVLCNRVYRARSASNVIAEIDELVERYGIEELIFFDENFSVSRSRTHELLDKIIERDYGICWYSSQGFALWTLDDEIIEKLARSGCYKIKFSVESGNERVLRDIIRKPVDLSKVPHIVAKCKEVGLVTGANFILGFPGETREELWDTYRFAKALDVDFTIFNVAMPYPQTDLCETAKELGYLPESYDFDQLNPGVANMDLPQFSKEELEKWYHEFWMELNFSTPEKEERYYRYAIRNPEYVAIEGPPMRASQGRDAVLHPPSESHQHAAR